jgi:hypothetical protein
MSAPEMIDGQMVRFKLHCDQAWHMGIVINAQKMWVECVDGFIGDESSIAEWCALRSPHIKKRKDAMWECSSGELDYCAYIDRSPWLAYVGWCRATLTLRHGWES